MGLMIVIWSNIICQIHMNLKYLLSGTTLGVTCLIIKQTFNYDQVLFKLPSTDFEFLFHLAILIAGCFQNQFFISGLSGDEIIQNRILEVLYRRIVLAHKEQKCFKVIVVMPLLPGFQVAIFGLLS